MWWLLIGLLALLAFRAWSGSGNVRAQNVLALTRQVYRWHAAAIQDANPMIAVLHANYAAGYIGALRSIATEAQFSEITGLSLPKLESEVTRAQDKALLALLDACPTLVPDSAAYTEYLEHLQQKV